jgi:hypothetical protein
MIRLPSAGTQLHTQMLDRNLATIGEHADRAHTVHNIAGRINVTKNGMLGEHIARRRERHQ